MCRPLPSVKSVGMQDRHPFAEWRVLPSLGRRGTEKNGHEHLTVDGTVSHTRGAGLAPCVLSATSSGSQPCQWVYSLGGILPVCGGSQHQRVRFKSRHTPTCRAPQDTRLLRHPHVGVKASSTSPEVSAVFSVPRMVGRCSGGRAGWGIVCVLLPGAHSVTAPLTSEGGGLPRWCSRSPSPGVHTLGGFPLHS